MTDKVDQIDELTYLMRDIFGRHDNHISMRVARMDAQVKGGG